jgi:hypothetical protein
MAGGVVIGRAVTAERCAARLAGSQMNPFISGFYALRTLSTLRVLYGLNRVDMNTGCLRHIIFLYSCST